MKGINRLILKVTGAMLLLFVLPSAAALAAEWQYLPDQS